MWLKLKKLLQNPIFLFIVWIGVVLLHSITTVNGEDYNNFSIFSASFFHAIDAKPLYIEYPSEYNDVFLYGIPFTAIIAPFSILPIKIGLPLWCVINAALLFYALFKLNLKKWQFALVILVSVNDMYTSVMSQQYGIAITAMIIFAFIWINKEKDFWASLMIALGTITKIYVIVGFAFFFFSIHKLKLSLSFIFWLIILALIPVLYTSFDYVLLSYKEWGEAIMHKNGLNDFTPYTNISLLGMLRKISGNANYSNLLVLVPGMILFCLPYLRIKLYGNMNFKLLYLASTLLFMILFSSGTESCGYFTGMIAVGIWF